MSKPPPIRLPDAQQAADDHLHRDRHHDHRRRRGPGAPVGQLPLVVIEGDALLDVDLDGTASA